MPRMLASAACVVALWLDGCAESRVAREVDEQTSPGTADGRDAGATSGDDEAGETGDAGGPVFPMRPEPDGGRASNGDDGDASTGQGTDAGLDPAADAGAGGSCLAGQEDCSGVCVNLDKSAAHCGACGHVCPANQACNGGVCAAPAGCSFNQFGGHDYFFCSLANNWGDARAACLGWGMDLAVIEAAPENDFIRAGGKQWIGYNDIDAEGSWLWIPRGNGGSNSGPSAPYTNWNDGEPNNTRSCTLGICSGPGEDCAEIGGDGRWNDAKCGNGQPFVCETY